VVAVDNVVGSHRAVQDLHEVELAVLRDEG